VEWVINSARKAKENEKKTNGDVEDRLKPSKEDDLADEETFAKGMED
jgi:hypothetical protein